MKSFVSFVAIEIYLIVVLFFSNPLLSQVITVRGNVTIAENFFADTIPVRYASIIFTNKSDTSKKFSAITDTAGNYQIGIITTVEKNRSIVPGSIELEQNYPNPFSSSTAISYKINKQLDVSIKIYDILGRVVKAFVMGSQGIGGYGIVWDGTDNFGKKVSPGIYFYQMRAGDETQVKKMVFGLGGMNVNASILHSGASKTIELNKANKAWIHGATAGTYTVQIEGVYCTTTPPIATKQFDNIAVQSDTTLNFVVARAAAQLPSPVYPAPYGSPVWHPDGRIAFNWTKILKIDRCRGSVNERDIDWDSSGFWMINPDGTGLQRLFTHGFDSPAWSPDGQWIAFGAVQIYKMKFTGTQFDTTTVVQLTTEGWNFLPAWSPDGEWIAYDNTVCGNAFEPPPPNSCGILVVRNDGTSRRFVRRGRFPHWSVDGSSLLYVGLRAEIFRVMVSDTSQVIRLTSFNQIDPYSRNNSYPKYSPDGTKIAFTSQPNRDIPQLWVMNSDGTNQQQLTTQGADLFFSWSPDGSRIVYVQHDARKADVHSGTLWIMNADGSNKRQLTFNHGLVFYP